MTNSKILAIILITFVCCCVDKPHELTAQDTKMWCEYEPSKSGAGKGKHIVLIAGDDEYRSEEALPMLGKLLASRHGFRCTVLFPVNEQGVVQPDYQQNIPGMQLLKDADLVILGLRFRNLPDEQMEPFDKYLESGRPIIGLRTTTHAFRIPADRKFARYSFNFSEGNWKGGFGQRVLGDTWISHHGHHGKESTRGIVNAENANHPILKGVTDVWGPTDVYTVENLPASATVIMRGQVVDGMQPTDKPLDGKKNDPMMPLAWTKSYLTKSGQTSRIFCTTMGAATDFESAGLRRLVLNASLWCLNLESSITPELSVSYVDTFNPTQFGFKNYQKNRKPSHYGLQTKSGNKPVK